MKAQRENAFAVDFTPILFTLVLLASLLFALDARAFQLQVKEAGTGTAITDFSYLINEDNTGDRSDPDPLNHSGLQPMPSHSPIVAAGDETTAGAITLPATLTDGRDARYLISVRAPGYKLWGQHLRLSNAAPDPGTVVIELVPEPLPLSRLIVQVFHDFAPVNGFPDFPYETPTEGPADIGLTFEDMSGFHVTIHDAVGEVTVDWFGNPICTQYDGNPSGSTPLGDPVPGTGGFCATDTVGAAVIENIPYGKYEVIVVPPEPNDKQWVQTTTFEGTRTIDAWLEEGTDGRGAVGEFRTEPGAQTAFVFGFTKAMGWANPGSGSITGTVRNVIVFPPLNGFRFGEPVYRPYIAVTDIGNTDLMVYRTRGNTDGTFTIPNVPAGTYQLAIWDEFLDYILAFYTVTIGTGQNINLNIADANGAQGLGVFRWFGWLSGYVFVDSDGDGIRDAGEPGIAGLGVGTPFRDGSQFQGAFTDNSGYFEFPELRGPLGKMFTVEVDFGRFAVTGHSVHDEQYALFNTRDPNPIVVDPGVGGGIILSQGVWEGRRSILDFGKLPYTGTDNGGISGRILYATTRNEFDASLQAAEDYEPGIPNVTVRLWGLGADNTPNTADDVLLNEVQSDDWEHPSLFNPDNPVNCDVRDKDGTDLTTLPGFEGAATAKLVADRCIEVPMSGNETKPGAYDGGWAFGDACETGILAGGDADNDGLPNDRDPDAAFDPDAVVCTGPITPADYVVQVLPPSFYQIVKEEDLNVAEGDELVPQFPPPPCVGDAHTVADITADFPGFPYANQSRPLCDKRLVTLQPQQNPGLDIFLFTTDKPYDPTLAYGHADNAWTTAESVPPPARFFGLVEDDLHINTDPNTITFGEKLNVPDLPIGIYDYTGRKLTMVYSDEHGFYDVLLPSTYTASCPIPGGVCPSMYVMVLNDPSDPKFRGDYLTEPLVFDAWPGKMTPTDTPVDPIATLTCDVPLGVPYLFAVNQPYMNAGGDFSLTITGSRMGTAAQPPTVTLNGTTLTVTNFTPSSVPNPNNPTDPANVFEDVVTVTVPGGFSPGAWELLIENNVSGNVSVNGLTFHVLGSGYNPPLVLVDPPADPAIPVIQNAINSASAGSLIVVRPGTYHENFIVHKNVRLQGYGPGGIVGAPEPEVAVAGADPNNPPNANLFEDPYFGHIPGTVVDGRFYQFDGVRRAAWDATLAGPASPFAGPATVPGGATVTVVGTVGEYGDEAGAGAFARIDGFAIAAGRGPSGGIYVHAYGRNLEISHNVFEGNQSRHGGAISIGSPLVEGGLADNQNDNVRMHRNRMLSNGGLFFAGGVGIFNGAANYDFGYNDVCGNFSSEYGGGVSHFGYSPNGKLHDNIVYRNDSFDEGGGIMIAGELPLGAPSNGVGSGPVDVERNLVLANLSNDDGGGIRLLRPGSHEINIRNNMIANNVATDFGGGIALDDASNVRIVNNTLAQNKSTSTAEDSDGNPHGAGLVSEPHSAGFQSALPPGAATFSNPVLFNNIFWQNEAFTWDATNLVLVSAGFIDMEVFGSSQVFSPNYSFLSVPYPGGANNTVGVDPQFVRDDFEGGGVQAAPNRLNLAEVQVTIVEGVEGPLVNFADFHLLPTSPAIDYGVASFAAVAAPTDDFDSETRPQGTSWDAGADETAGAVAPQILFYFSTPGNTTVPGVAGPYDDADIYSYDGTSFARLFDATANGVPGGADIDGLVVVDSDTFYMSFVGGHTLPGVGSVADEDVVLFNAGVWTMYFDGSDVGLSGGEDIDAFEILADGSIVVSGTGSVTVPGIGGTQPAHDLLRCAGTFGPATSCTWSRYFDASDVGLGTSGENIDGVSVLGSDIYITTLGNFSVPGASGTGADILLCAGATTGDASACTTRSLFFDASAVGLGGLMDAVDRP